MKDIIFFCYPRCSTCQKAKKWLEENSIKFTERDIVKDKPTEKELKEFFKKSGKELKKFFKKSKAFLFSFRINFFTKNFLFYFLIIYL